MPKPSPRVRRFGLVLALTALASAGGKGLEATEDSAKKRAAAAWERRADGSRGGNADPGPVSAAIDAWREVLDTDPEDHTTRVKLLRALYFLAEYATPAGGDKAEAFARGRDLAEDGIDRLARGFAGDPRPRFDDEAALDALVEHLAGRPQGVGVYLWAANHWALWGRHSGPLAAARQGTASKIRDYAHVVLAVDPSYDSAGGHRVLGRLHHEAPRVPFVTGWIRRQEAVEQLDRARLLAPDDLLGRFYWIESVLAHERDRVNEALAELRRLTLRQPDPQALVEERRILDDARALLAEVEG